MRWHCLRLNLPWKFLKRMCLPARRRCAGFGASTTMWTRVGVHRLKYRRIMDYELRIISEGPNSAPALDLYRQVLAEENAAGDVRAVQVDREEQAQMLCFHGSPSFIAGGHDLFPSTAPPALTCRVYLGANGLAGLPSQGDVKAALRSTRSTLCGLAGRIEGPKAPA